MTERKSSFFGTQPEIPMLPAEPYLTEQTARIMRAVHNDTAMHLLAVVYTAKNLPLVDITSGIESLRETENPSVTAPEGWMAFAELFRGGLIDFEADEFQNTGLVRLTGRGEALRNSQQTPQELTEETVRELLTADPMYTLINGRNETEQRRRESDALYSKAIYVLHRIIDDHPSGEAPLTELDPKFEVPYSWTALAHVYNADFITYDHERHILSPTERGCQFYRRVQQAVDFVASQNTTH